VIVSGIYDATLVTLSILIATMASYTALDLAGRIAAAGGWAKHAWFATAALAMGGGIWSMHFIGMLAFSMAGMDLSYDVGLTILSLIVPIIVAGAGFYLASQKGADKPVRLAVAGLFMGLGIVAMHYTGMAAMRMTGHVSYDSFFVALSVVIAIGASTVALWLAFLRTGIVQKLMAAVVMGIAVSGMHYTAMHAAIFTAHSATGVASHVPGLNQTALALAVAVTTFLILFFALAAAMFDRRFALMAEREAAALRESEERFRTLYRRTPLPLYSLDRNGLVEYVSDAWLELLGFSREEVIGRPLTDFMTEESMRRRIEVDWPKLFDTEELRDVECRFVTRAGNIVEVVTDAKVVRNARGEPVVLGGLVDVTARKRAEEALRQSQKIEAIGQLVGGVAHDFNNLLAVVLGSLELLRRRLPQDAKIVALVDNAIQGARRGSALTQRMLSFARRQELKPAAVDIPNLVAGLGDLLRRSIGPMVRIETHFPTRLSRARVDANQLELALVNLAVNARDAMADATGLITIAALEETVQRDDPHGLPPGKYVRLSVTDTGLGMDEQTLARATEPFFTTKGIGKGTGLGLPMAHGLAAQSGGKLVLRSRPGEGTVVEIWLPAVTATEEVNVLADTALAVSANEMPVFRPLSVLVVDDDSLVLVGTAAMLEDLGHTVILASSGKEALATLGKGEKFDLVITDLAMPDMTGLQLAAAIKSGWSAMPIIVATGYSELDGDTDLPKLSKPFSQEDLARALAACLQSARENQKAVPFSARTRNVRRRF
jgi:PAS domain S-box-containing protein